MKKFTLLIILDLLLTVFLIIWLTFVNDTFRVLSELFLISDFSVTETNNFKTNYEIKRLTDNERIHIFKDVPGEYLYEIGKEFVTINNSDKYKIIHRYMDNSINIYLCSSVNDEHYIPLSESFIKDTLKVKEKNDVK